MSDNANAQAALYGGISVAIKRLENTVAGPRLVDDSVLVRKLPVRLMQDWLVAQEKEPAMVALACNKDAAWVETLADESFLAVLTKAEELNGDFLDQFWKRKLAKNERLLGQGYYAKTIEKAALPLSPSSPTS